VCCCIKLKVNNKTTRSVYKYFPKFGKIETIEYDKKNNNFYINFETREDVNKHKLMKQKSVISKEFGGDLVWAIHISFNGQEVCFKT
jgi:hypothetical protein